MTFLLYFLISFIACIIGAISGIGGGIIIKPVLDTLSDYSLSAIGMLSTCTVLTMTIISLIKSRKNNVKVNFHISFYLALGSICGGIVGQKCLESLLFAFANDYLAAALQSILLIILNIWIILYLKMKSRFKVYHFTGKILCLMIGLGLGGIASFLGIGGGPINIAVLAIIFGMDSKTAALNSIFIVFFSQWANLLRIFCKNGVLSVLTLPPLPFMLIGAVLGGYVGSRLVKKMTNDDVDRFFMVVLMLIIVINFYNFVDAAQGFLTL